VILFPQPLGCWDWRYPLMFHENKQIETCTLSLREGSLHGEGFVVPTKGRLISAPPPRPRPPPPPPPARLCPWNPERTSYFGSTPSSWAFSLTYCSVYSQEALERVHWKKKKSTWERIWKNMFLISAVERDMKVTDSSLVHLFRRTSQRWLVTTPAKAMIYWLQIIGRSLWTMERGLSCHHRLLHPHANGRAAWVCLIETVRVETAEKPAASIYSLGFYGERRAPIGDPLK
jgi:hypothetical protein